jgi:hypothetical protein
VKAYFTRYKRKIQYLLRLCLDAQEKNINVSLTYYSTIPCISIYHFVDDDIFKRFHTHLGESSAENNLNEAIIYVQKLIEGDTNVCT